MKYFLITYGCQMNTADAEEMAQPLVQRGLTATADIDQADIVLMNTCTVRAQAEHRAQSNLGRLREWKAEDPNRLLIVAGCAASRWGESIRKRYPYIDAVSPATKIEEFPELIAKILKDRWDGHAEEDLAAPAPSAPRPESFSMDAIPQTTDPGLFGGDATAYVTIMRGCNYSCSYCIVPQVRGREVYRDPEEIRTEIRNKVAQGAKEVMLLGQTVNSYFHRTAKGVIDFAELLRSVNSLEGVYGIRFMSPHPWHMRDRVIEAMRDCEKVRRHIHLPVQSGSDRLLMSMRRFYTRGDYASIVGKLRAAIPGILVTTDIIVGYPGEQESDLEQTLRLLDEIQFDGLFAFKYSARPGTPAAALPDDVPAALKEERLQKVLAHNRLVVAGKQAWSN